jgi:quercetin dioxygenase-like cupin family protein
MLHSEVYCDPMTYRIADPGSISPGPGPHPAASPFDKRISKALGLTAFEVYQVELPAHQHTVRHDHRADRVEDLYAFTAGTGWVVVDDEEIPIRQGLYIAVAIDAARHVRAGDDGLTFTAICGPRREPGNLP